MSGTFVEDRNNQNEDGTNKMTTLQWVTPE